LALAAAAPSAAAAPPFVLDDLFKIDRVDQAAISPDATQVAVVTERRTLEYVGASAGTLSLVSTADGSVRRAVEDPAERSQTRPVWSPDGRYLLYTARGEGGPGLRLLRLADGQVDTPQVCAESESVGATAWSPDGGRFAAICNGAPK